MTDSDAIRAAAAVQRWFASAGHHETPWESQQRLLTILADFTAHTGRGPDELVAFCFLRKRDTGERFVSVKRRVEVNTWIDGFVAIQGWSGKNAVAYANVIRGFLIHNGVLIQGAVWTGD